MSRYRDLTRRYPHLTDEEHAERLSLALAGWHVSLLDAPHTCGRVPGDDDDDYMPPGAPERRAACAQCGREADETDQESDGHTTIGEALAGGTWRDNRRDRLSAAIGDTGAFNDAAYRR